MYPPKGANIKHFTRRKEHEKNRKFSFGCFHGSDGRRDHSAGSREKEGDEDRAIALGGLKRVYNSRQKARSKSKLAIVTMRKGVEDHDSSDDSDEEIVRDVTPITQNTSNHYTLNLPGPAPTRSDLPYVLLGYVY